MVHLHALVYGEFVPQEIVQAIWSDVLGELGIAFISAIDTTAGIGGALREVLKYATKGEIGVRDGFSRAASVELALRNVKRVSIGGALRGIKVNDQDAATSDDTRPEDLHDQRKAPCENCGLVGELRWLGSVAQRDVARNGGFGRFTVDNAGTPCDGLTRRASEKSLTRELTDGLTGCNPTLTPQKLHANSEESRLPPWRHPQITCDHGVRHEH
jgi:hypothetical protein